MQYEINHFVPSEFYAAVQQEQDTKTQNFQGVDTL